MQAFINNEHVKRIDHKINQILFLLTKIIGGLLC